MMGFSMFQTKKPQTELKFTTRAEAFSYMLMYMTEEKHAEPLEAAQKANEFADIFARNMGIPLKIEPEPQGVRSRRTILRYCGKDAPGTQTEEAESVKEARKNTKVSGRRRVAVE